MCLKVLAVTKIALIPTRRANLVDASRGRAPAFRYAHLNQLTASVWSVGLGYRQRLTGEAGSDREREFIQAERGTNNALTPGTGS